MIDCLLLVYEWIVYELGGFVLNWCIDYVEMIMEYNFEWIVKLGGGIVV